MNQNLSNLGKQEKTMRKTELKLCSDYSSTELCGKGSKGNLKTYILSKYRASIRFSKPGVPLLNGRYLLLQFESILSDKT